MPDRAARFSRRRLEVAAVAVIVLLALFLRAWNLDELPAGFHGDEAVVGMEAQRILDEGYIGPYSPYAAGQPTGPIYLVAPAVALLGNSYLAVRIVPALLGTLTVLALYIVTRRSFGVPAALVAALVLAVMSWHLHFSRIGFPIIAWPLLAVLLAGSLAEAVRTGDWRWWMAAGVLTGGGIYVYNAHPLLAVATGLFIAGYLVLNGSRPVLEDLGSATLFAVAAVLVMVPMVRFAAAEDSDYWFHFERDSVTATEEWQALDGPAEHVRFVANGYREIWNWLCCEPDLDPVDGTGLTVITPKLMLLLAAAGVVFALTGWRKPLGVFGLLVVLILPLGPVLSVGGEVRRNFAMAPFLAMFAGVAVAGMILLARRVNREMAIPIVVIAVVLPVAVVAQNYSLYFRDFAEPHVQEDVLARPMADVTKFLDERGDSDYVHFYSAIWSFDYVTRLFLAPDARGEDRSREHGQYRFGFDDRYGPPLFIFLDDYLDDIETVREIYPGEEITPQDPGRLPTFRAFQPELP